MRPLLILLCLFSLITTLRAQPRSGGGGTTVYPTRLYPGENVITITNERGIDKIRYRASTNTTVEVPVIRGCPRTIDIRVRVASPTTNENMDLTVYDCNGSFGTHALTAENWTIRREFTGEVEVGRDTCITCEIITGDEKMIDSITMDNPSFRVMVPEGGPPWLATDSSFTYRICYKPERVESIDESIRLYVRRSQPNAGLTQYVINKPVNAVGVPARIVVKDPDPIDTIPPLEDPTTFRNILMPTAESVGSGRFFLGNYELVGWTAGYGFSDNFTGMMGVVVIPDLISRLLVATVGGKYEIFHEGDIRFATGFQYAYSSTAESDITVSAPYGILSYGNRARRISIGGGYSWKHHKTKTDGEFERNAYIVALGGDFTFARGWKVAAETYVVESSGLAPLAVTVRWFKERFAFDGGLVMDLAGTNDVRGTSTLSGEIRKLSIVPMVSFIWKW